MVDPLEFELLDHNQRYASQKEVEDELKEQTDNDDTLGAMLMLEKSPLQKSLDYKLNLAIFSY